MKNGIQPADLSPGIVEVSEIRVVVFQVRNLCANLQRVLCREAC